MLDPAKPYDLLFPVTPVYAAARLDLFVKAMVPSMSRAKIQRYCVANRVLVNDAPRAPNWRVRLHDRVRLSCREPENIDAATARLREQLARLIICEDDAFAAINKPAGLVAHPAGKHRHDTLLNALYAHYKNLLPDDCEISLANRLDQFTSGVILAAKTLSAKQNLQNQFENRRVQKIYYALAKGIVESDRGEITLPLGPAEPGSTRLQAVRDDRFGKTARTEYEVLERFFAPAAADCADSAAHKNAGITFLRLRPHTGRQHQLRVHLAAIGRPLIADAHYGDAKILRFADGATVNRYPLHAAELFFTHPLSGAPQHLTAPLADDLQIALDHLRAGENYTYQ